MCASSHIIYVHVSSPLQTHIHISTSWRSSYYIHVFIYLHDNDLVKTRSCLRDQVRLDLSTCIWAVIFVSSSPGFTRLYIYVCVCVYIYTCTYIHKFISRYVYVIYTSKYIYMYTYMYMHIHIYVYGYVCIHMCIHIHIHRYTCMSMYLYTYTQEYICIYVYIYTCAYVYICIRRYINSYVFQLAARLNSTRTKTCKVQIFQKIEY